MEPRSNDETGAIVVLTTLPVTADRSAFARVLVEERLAACVSIAQEMQSTYRWQGTVLCDAEHQVIIKTTTDRLSGLEARVKTLHPYELPEWLVLRVAGGSPGYLGWLRESGSREL
jgi:periplasmic divalent cation tolerance protein